MNLQITLTPEEVEALESFFNIVRDNTDQVDLMWVTQNSEKYSLLGDFGLCVIYESNAGIYYINSWGRRLKAAMETPPLSNTLIVLTGTVEHNKREVIICLGYSQVWQLQGYRPSDGKTDTEKLDTWCKVKGYTSHVFELPLNESLKISYNG